MRFKQSMAAVLCGIALSGFPLSSMASPPPGVRWRMSFHDEFRSPTLNSAFWSTDYPAGYPHGNPNDPNNRELQLYTDKGSIHIDHGGLSIDGKALPTAQKKSGYAYSSGLISTHGKFQQTYGYFEARMKVPKGSGTWPAFRLLPVNGYPAADLPEISVMETFGPNVGVAFHTYLFATPRGETRRVFKYTQNEDFSKDYHVYGVYWAPDRIQWYVDDVPVHETTLGLTRQPMILMLNLALNADVKNNGALQQKKMETLLIDYVRVYEEK